ncbi:hypothetical protein M758_2G111400 [Ceratodon purpureus]|nr:hypothetical protein M758_2G111400 [Ceratodon purpureus]
MSTRRALCAWAPLLRRCRTAGANGRGRGTGDGGSLGLVARDCQRSLATSSLGVREGGGSSEARVWSRASFARSKFASGYTALAPKKLDQIMKIETVIFSPPEEITQIWNDVWRLVNRVYCVHLAWLVSYWTGTYKCCHGE